MPKWVIEYTYRMVVDAETDSEMEEWMEAGINQTIQNPQTKERIYYHDVDAWEEGSR
jgi:hypothetical protein